MFRSLRVPAYWLAMLLLGACTDSCDRVDEVDVHPYALDDCLLVGDTTTMTAEALNRSAGFRGILYTSDTDPEKFSWASTAPEIASVADGLVRGLQVGRATIQSTTQGVTGGRLLSVERPVADIVITLSSDAISVGDTFDVTADARDADGQPLPGAGLRLGPSGGELTMLPWPNDEPPAPSPVTRRFRADVAGSSAVSARWGCIHQEPVRRELIFGVAP